MPNQLSDEARAAMDIYFSEEKAKWVQSWRKLAASLVLASLTVAGTALSLGWSVVLDRAEAGALARVSDKTRDTQKAFQLLEDLMAKQMTAITERYGDASEKLGSVVAQRTNMEEELRKLRTMLETMATDSAASSRVLQQDIRATLVTMNDLLAIEAVRLKKATEQIDGLVSGIPDLPEKLTPEKMAQIRSLVLVLESEDGMAELAKLSVKITALENSSQITRQSAPYLGYNPYYYNQLLGGYGNIGGFGGGFGGYGMLPFSGGGTPEQRADLLRRIQELGRASETQPSDGEPE